MIKTFKQALILTAALLVAAVTAQASWTIVTPNAETVTPGQSGSSTWRYTPDISGTIGTGFDLNIIQNSPFNFWSSGGTVTSFTGSGSDPIASWSISGEPTHFTAGTPFSVTVAWRISSAPIGGSRSFFVNFSLPTSNGDQTSSQNFTEHPTAVPEPAQVIAGSLLLGCGGLVFVGRRLFKKQA